jgi:WW domain-binding protein 2
LIYYDGVELALEPSQSAPIMKGNKKGRIYLTSHRIVFVNKNPNDLFQVRAEPQGRWEGTAKFKLWFNNGGAIEFGQCLLNAGRLGEYFIDISTS